MKLVIFSAIFIVVAVASPLVDDGSDTKPGRYEYIPDGFGALKYVNIDEEQQEVTPAFVPDNDIRLLLFTRANPLVPQILHWSDMSTVVNSHWSSARDTKLICHGWQSTANTPVNPMSTEAYLRNADNNVIVVDWSVGAASINYITSRNNVNPAGDLVARFLNNLLSSGHLRAMNTVSCVGQSLGAHVCGAAGKRTNGLMNSIFGLDPAGPLFTVGNPANRLDAGDAEYVEIIHTDIVALGIGDPIGHADYYPNGGTGMPGCDSAFCDHAIAADYFAESINSDGLWGRRCASLDQMHANACTGDGYSMGGQPSNNRINLRGIFRMPTNPASPFGFGPF